MLAQVRPWHLHLSDRSSATGCDCQLQRRADSTADQPRNSPGRRQSKTGPVEANGNRSPPQIHRRAHSTHFRYTGRARWWGLFAVVSVMLINFAVELVIADVVEDSGNWQAFTVAGVCAPARRLVATAAVCVGAPRKRPSRRGWRWAWSLHNNASAVVNRCARVKVDSNRLGTSGKRVRLRPAERQN